MDLFRNIIASALKRRVEKLLRTHKVRIVAVTGSVGKTSTKLAIAHFLRRKFKVIANEKSYNTEIGLPLSIFGLDVPSPIWNPFAWILIFMKIAQLTKKYPYEVAVLEMGADKPGDIKYLTSFIHPEIAVLTAIAPVHTELFGSVEKILEEKWLITQNASEVVINADDEMLTGKASSSHSVYGYGLKRGQVKVIKTERKKSTLRTVIDMMGEKVEADTQLIGPHSLYSLLAGVLVANLFGLSKDEIAAAIPEFKPVKGRMNALMGINGSFIIDDTYNSSPEAAKAALETLHGLEGRKIAVLGSMNELGSLAEESHREVGAFAAERADLLIAVGDLADKFIANEAKKYKGVEVHSFATALEAGSFLRGVLVEGDVVLVKGSQGGIFLEETVKMILQVQADSQNLVRQDPGWLKKKEKFFRTKLPR